jgi:diguanylate cyclase (GGDEF)-like protein/PAS domain S-box-containing protein
MDKLAKLQGNLLSSIINQSPVSTWIADANGTNIWQNAACRKLFGIDRDEQTVGEYNLFTDHVLKEQGFAALIRSVFEDGDTVKAVIDYDFSKVDTVGVPGATHRILDVTVFPIKDSTGKVVNAVIQHEDITDRKKMEDELKNLATHDALTGLYNRAFFEEEMRLLSKERKVSTGILVIDIDGLKYINDAFGHQQGDRMLLAFSKILTRTFRPSDVVARIGGDEFGVLIRDVDEFKIWSITERLRSNLNVHNKSLKGNRSPINISLGYSIKNDNSKTVEQTFKEADDMLFRDKIPKREDVRRSILNVLRTTMLEKDFITEEHMERIRNTAVAFGDIVKLNPTEMKAFVLATELHDIGKVVIPDQVLSKMEALTPEEFEVIKKHPETGYRIAEATPETALIAEYILHSHERWDGKGYPQGLKGEEIPLISRMIFILDAYDAMTNDRHYRKALNKEEAILKLKKNAGTQFDPELVDIFVNGVLLNN